MADRVHPTPLSSIFDVIRETGAALATLSGLSARRERRDAADFDVTVPAWSCPFLPGPACTYNVGLALCGPTSWHKKTR